jgi:antitoxin component YwqK of YwqJK toxin-antitoxin module
MFCFARIFNLKIASVLPVVGLLAACHPGSIKVVSEKYDSGQPKVVFYFHSEEDALQHPVAIVNNGISHASKPLSFDIERYYPGGTLYCKGQYVNGQTCGLWQYFYSSGIRQAKCYYWNGIPRDTAYCWYPSGNLRRYLLEIDTTRRHWHGIDYYESGQKSTESSLTADSGGALSIEGDYQAWYASGRLKIQATAEDGWSTGKWQRWDSAGVLEAGDTTIGLSY